MIYNTGKNKKDRKKFRSEISKIDYLAFMVIKSFVSKIKGAEAGSQVNCVAHGYHHGYLI